MALSIGSPIQVALTDTTASLSVPVATGGTAPYSYQWYRDTSPTFTPSSANILTGQTATTIIDGAAPNPLQPNTIYYYAVVVTDATTPTPLSVTSSVLGICTQSQGNTLWTNPAVTDFQNFYYRDFPYGPNINTQVTNTDIMKAYQQANLSINQINYLKQGSYTQGYLWLSAHRLCVNINNSSQGLNGQFNWGEQSKSVGGVSQSFAIPEQVTKNPVFAAFTKTTYGADYLMDLLPRLTGAMGSVAGHTKP